MPLIWLQYIQRFSIFTNQKFFYPVLFEIKWYSQKNPHKLGGMGCVCQLVSRKQLDKKNSGK